MEKQKMILELSRICKITCITIVIILLIAVEEFCFGEITPYNKKQLPVYLLSNCQEDYSPIEKSINYFFSAFKEEWYPEKIYEDLPDEIKLELSYLAKEYSTLFSTGTFEEIRSCLYSASNAYMMCLNDKDDIDNFFKRYGSNAELEEQILQKTGFFVNKIMSNESYIKSKEGDGFSAFLYMVRRTIPPELLLDNDPLILKVVEENKSSTVVKVKISACDPIKKYKMKFVKISDDLWVPELFVEEWEKIFLIARNNIEIAKSRLTADEDNNIRKLFGERHAEILEEMNESRNIGFGKLLYDCAVCGYIGYGVKETWNHKKYFYACKTRIIPRYTSFLDYVYNTNSYRLDNQSVFSILGMENCYNYLIFPDTEF